MDRLDLQVMAISSPTWADGVRLQSKIGRRLSFYSSADQVIAGRVDDWPKLAAFSRDLDWLSHDTDHHLNYIAMLFEMYLEGRLPEHIDEIQNPSTTKQEDEIS